jgi:hypothetical protein
MKLGRQKKNMWTFTRYEVMTVYNEFHSLTKCWLVHQQKLYPLFSTKLVQIESRSCVLVEDSPQGLDIATSHLVPTFYVPEH